MDTVASDNAPIPAKPKAGARAARPDLWAQARHMHCVQGMTLDDVGAHFGKTAGTIQGWIERCEYRMHEALVETGAIAAFGAWEAGSWAQATEYQKACWRGVSEAVFDSAAKAMPKPSRGAARKGQISALLTLIASAA